VCSIILLTKGGTTQISRPKNVITVKCGEKVRLEYSLMKILNAKLSFPELKGSRDICFLGESLLCVICVLGYSTITVEQPPLGLRELRKTDPPKCVQQVDLRQKLQIF